MIESERRDQDVTTKNAKAAKICTTLQAKAAHRSNETIRKTRESARTKARSSKAIAAGALFPLGRWMLDVERWTLPR
jgi:hypothetical protein